MRITEAARRLGTSPRMLRYRESLGLLPGLRTMEATAAPHRQFSEQDLDAVALALAIERRYDISPAALSFGIRVLTEPGVRAEVAELGRRIGRIQAPAARALDFEQERALRLLSMGRQPPGAGRGRPARTSVIMEQPRAGGGGRRAGGSDPGPAWRGGPPGSRGR
ncbi:MAG TPA: MerR family transcriptional regulator [Streptosporangiaceae bacterium]|nr:MerR family transcriptional regulator [Streptosporangiaceae bacterium]